MKALPGAPCRALASRPRIVPSLRASPLAAVLLGVLAVACARKEAPRGIGRRVADGAVAALRASADGTHLAYLHDCRPVKDRTLPAGTSSCDLAVVPSGGGTPTRVASRVTTLAPGFAWSRSGHVLAALADYDHADGSGDLVVWSGGPPRQRAQRVRFFAIDRQAARIGWVADERLVVAPAAGGDPVTVAGAAGVATFEFGDDDLLLARTSLRAGGALLLVKGPEATQVASGTREYAFSSDGTRFAFTSGASQALSVARSGAAPAALARDVQGFLFPPRGDLIAYVADAGPGRLGDLWVAPVGGGAPVRLGRKVGEARWCADGSRLGWLQGYDPRGRTGTFTVGGPDGPSREVAANVSDFDLTRDGAWAAFLHHATAGGYSVDLGMARTTAAANQAPVAVARGVFGFSFSPDGKWLLYRTACVREGEACDLMRIGVSDAKGSAAPAPERLAEGVKSFEPAPGRPERLLVTWSRKDRVALDVAVWEHGKLVAVDTYALPGSVQFVGSDPRRLAYAVIEPKREGVYVAEVE